MVRTETGCDGDVACFRAFVERFGLRAFRRPLDASEVDDFSALYTQVAQGDVAQGAQLAVEVFLQSPHFLYRPEFGQAAQGGGGQIGAFERASRLSYLLWGTMPDDTLLAVAAEDRLQGRSLEDEITRMLADPKAQRGVLSVVGEWFDLDHLSKKLKDPSYGFNDQVRGELRESWDRFIWSTVLKVAPRRARACGIGRLSFWSSGLCQPRHRRHFWGVRR